MTNQSSSMRKAGLAIATIGAFFAASALPPLHAIAHLFLSVAYWPLHSVPTGLAVPSPLLLVITGGLTAGLGAAIWALGTHVVPLSGAAAAKVTSVTVWTWFVIDSTGSALVGAPVNVLLNVGFLALALLASRPERNSAAQTV